MNIRWGEIPIPRQVLFVFLLILFLLVFSSLVAWLSPSVSVLELFARANSTRTSIALTSRALMGPFPTATGPTPTPSRTPADTSTPTPTPSITPSPTRIRYFIDTATPRTLVPQTGQTSTSVPPTNPPRQPTNPPRVTRQPRPTRAPRATHQPRPTRPPKPTKTPRR